MKFKLLGAGALFVGFSMSAMAYPNLETITGVAGTSHYTDTGAEAVYLTDTSGVEDDFTAFRFFEIEYFETNNQFGIYDFSRDANGNLTLGDSLELFNGMEDEPHFGGPVSVTVGFDLANGTATNANSGQVANIGSTFGFYLQNSDSFLYSHKDLNNGVNHSLIFNTSDNSVSDLQGSDVVVAFGGMCLECMESDMLYNDMVVGVTDVLPVPEPGTLALLGLGLVGLGAARRRQKAA